MARGGPYYRMWWKDLQTDAHYRAMSLEERGAYRDLLDFNYAEGALPNDLSALARMIGATGTEMQRLWPVLRARFVELPDGRLTNPRMAKELTWWEAQSEKGRRAGKASAQARSGKQDRTSVQPGANHTDTDTYTVLDNKGIAEGIFQHWLSESGHTQSQFTEKRRSKVRQRLRRFTPEQLKQAITNACATPFYRGQNESGTRYDWLETILKNDEAVERHLERKAKRSELPTLTRRR